jgi:hypothetical protein
MKTKRLTSLLLASAMVFSLSACGNSADKNSASVNVDSNLSRDVSDLTPVKDGIGYLDEGVKQDDAGVGFITPENMSVYGITEDDAATFVYDTNYTAAVQALEVEKEANPVSFETYTKTLDEGVSKYENSSLSDINSQMSVKYNGIDFAYPFDLSTLLNDGWTADNAFGDAAGFRRFLTMHNDKYKGLCLEVTSYDFYEGTSTSGYAGLVDVISEHGIYNLSLLINTDKSDLDFCINDVSVFQSDCLYEMLKNVNTDSLMVNYKEITSLDDLKGFTNGCVEYSQYDSSCGDVTISFDVNDAGQISCLRFTFVNVGEEM